MSDEVVRNIYEAIVESYFKLEAESIDSEYYDRNNRKYSIRVLMNKDNYDKFNNLVLSKNINSNKSNGKEQEINGIRFSIGVTDNNTIQVHANQGNIDLYKDEIYSFNIGDIIVNVNY